MFELGLGLEFEKMFDSGLARKFDLVKVGVKGLRQCVNRAVDVCVGV